MLAMSCSRYILIGLLVNVTLLMGSANAATYRTTDLGWGTQAYDINNSGFVVGYSYQFDLTYPRAFLYNGAFMQDLGVFGGFASVAYSINNTGQIVGHYTGNSSHAFLYSRDAMQDIGVLSGGPYSSAAAINSAGTVVGWSNSVPYVGANYHGFQFFNGNMMDIGSLQGNPGNTSATDINDLGQIVGKSLAPLGNHAFLYSNGTMFDLGVLPGGNSSEARAINNVGQIVGGSSTMTAQGLESHAFLYDNGRMTDIGFLGGELDTLARGINDSGEIVGSSNGRAFYYNGGAMVDLNSTLASPIHAVLVNAGSINIVGQIVADGSDGHSYVLTPIAVVPEPSALLLVAFGIIALKVRSVPKGAGVLPFAFVMEKGKT
jgi:probable HAF family extracellular repeat protein